MDGRLIDSGIPEGTTNPEGEFATMRDPRPATAADMAGLGVAQRILHPPPGILVAETVHPISKMPSYACLDLKTEYQSRGWTFYDTAMVEGDIRLGQVERALAVKRTNSNVCTYILFRQAWTLGVQNLTREGDYLKNKYINQIIRDAGFPPKEVPMARRTLSWALDRALHDMKFFAPDSFASLKGRKKWEVNADIEQRVEKYSPDGRLELVKREVI